MGPPPGRELKALPPAAGANLLARRSEVYVVQIVGESTGDRIGLQLEAGRYHVRWLEHARPEGRACPRTGRTLGAEDTPDAHDQEEPGLASFEIPPNDGHVVLHLVRR